MLLVLLQSRVFCMKEFQPVTIFKGARGKTGYANEFQMIIEMHFTASTICSLCEQQGQVSCSNVNLRIP